MTSSTYVYITTTTTEYSFIQVDQYISLFGLQTGPAEQ